MIRRSYRTGDGPAVLGMVLGLMALVVVFYGVVLAALITVAYYTLRLLGVL